MFSRAYHWLKVKFSQVHMLRYWSEVLVPEWWNERCTEIWTVDSLPIFHCGLKDTFLQYP